MCGAATDCGLQYPRSRSLVNTSIRTPSYVNNVNTGQFMRQKLQVHSQLCGGKGLILLYIRVHYCTLTVLDSKDK